MRGEKFGQRRSAPRSRDAVGVGGVRPGGGGADAIAAFFEREGAIREVAPGAALVLQGAPVRSVYRVLSGILRIAVIFPDGRRHVTRFAGPGDVVGIPLLPDWSFAVEAVERVTLRSAPAGAFETALGADRRLAREVARRLAAEFEERERLFMALAYLHADDRLCGFLKRFAPLGHADAGFIRLPMTRQDIGDHLGLTHETVSRSFGALKRRAYIEMEGASRYRLLPRALGSAFAA